MVVLLKKERENLKLAENLWTGRNNCALMAPVSRLPLVVARRSKAGRSEAEEQGWR